ncbi:aldo/keto reductase [Qingshengfaniella alkalisoli]|nr:aldo/keto reductase [Qingshengfaniella alkalisoli]
MKVDAIPLPNTRNVRMPKIGIGTWGIGEDSQAAEGEIAALRHARDLGFRHFDTAEMYADGGAEDILGRAFGGQGKDDLFITSKVYAWNASRDDHHTWR